MAYKLLVTLHSEVEANVVAGRLENEGIKTKINFADLYGTKTMTPNAWGVYVDETQETKARELLPDLKFEEPFASRKHASPLVWIGLVLLGILIVVLVISKIFQL